MWADMRRSKQRSQTSTPPREALVSGSPQSSQATLTQYDRLLAAWSDQSAGVHSMTARLLPNTTNT